MKKLSHKVLKTFYKKSYKQFLSALNAPESTQYDLLKKTLASPLIKNFWKNKNIDTITSYHQLIQKIPITTYADYANTIESLRSQLNIRWEPTSGSTQKRKWIPYSAEFLKQLHNATGPWLYDLYQQFPDLEAGPHFWSLSWLPEDLRGLTQTDDSELFPWWQRILLNRIFAVPPELATVKTSEAYWFGLLVYLASQEDLKLISVWSPTFLLQIIQDLQKHWPAIVNTLHQGQWALHQEELLSIPVPISRSFDLADSKSLTHSLWPELRLISCWDTSTSALFVQKLKEHFSHQVVFQGKGLWATEGVVSIPFQNQKPLALRSHFYEFKDLNSEKVINTNQLQPGMHVKPIITCANGFLRYQMEDIIEVEKKLLNTPCVRFLSRDQSVDLAGEKLDHHLAQQIIKNLSQKFTGYFLSLKACIHPHPHYKLIAYCSPNLEKTLQEELEKELLQIHHYKVARELQQLAPAQLQRYNSLEQALESFQKSQILGQNKVETLFLGN